MSELRIIQGKDTFCARLQAELLRGLYVTFRHKKVHHQLVHVLFPDLDVVELLLPLLPRDDLLGRRLHDADRWSNAKQTSRECGKMRRRSTPKSDVCFS